MTMTRYLQTACPGCGQIPCDHKTACCPLPPTLTVSDTFDAGNPTFTYHYVATDWKDNVWIPKGEGL